MYIYLYLFAVVNSIFLYRLNSYWVDNNEISLNGCLNMTAVNTVY